MAVNITVVGCGAVARNLYQKPLAALERKGLVRVTALVDHQLAHAQKMGSSFSRARLFSELAEALGEGRSELTLVLSPHHLHAAHAITAFNHGNHVLCEKPMAVTVSDCTAMIDAARAARRVLALGMIRRYFPAFAQLKKWVDSGVLGEIHSFYYREGKVFDWDVTTPAGFTKTATGGGGVLLDIGTHVIDFLMWVFGAPKALSYADDSLGGVEANVVMELQFPVCKGTVQLSWDSPLKNEMRVVGSKGEAVLYVDELDRIAVCQSGVWTDFVSKESFPADLDAPSHATLAPQLYSQCLYCQLIQALRAIRLGEPPAVRGEAGLACLNTIEMARRLAVPLNASWLNGQQQQAYETLHWASA